MMMYLFVLASSYGPDIRVFDLILTRGLPQLTVILQLLSLSRLVVPQRSVWLLSGALLSLALDGGCRNTSGLQTWLDPKHDVIIISFLLASSSFIVTRSHTACIYRINTCCINRKTSIIGQYILLLLNRHEHFGDFYYYYYYEIILVTTATTRSTCRFPGLLSVYTWCALGTGLWSDYCHNSATDDTDINTSYYNS